MTFFQELQSKSPLNPTKTQNDNTEILFYKPNRVTDFVVYGFTAVVFGISAALENQKLISQAALMSRKRRNPSLYSVCKTNFRCYRFDSVLDSVKISIVILGKMSS